MLLGVSKLQLFDNTFCELSRVEQRDKRFVWKNVKNKREVVYPFTYQ